MHVYIFPNFGCMLLGVCAYMHATFLVVEQLIGSRAKLYMGNILLLAKNRRSDFFSLNHNNGFASIIL